MAGGLALTGWSVAVAASVWADPADLVDRNYITYGSTPEAGFEYEQIFEPSKALPSRIIAVESVSIILRYVAAGLGVTVLPGAVVDEAASNGNIAATPFRDDHPVAWWALTGPVPPDNDLVDLTMTVLRRSLNRWPEPVTAA